VNTSRTFTVIRDAAILEVTGSERASWLQGMVTTDVLGLVPGECRYGLTLDVKGRVLADVMIVSDRDAPRLLLIGTASGQAALRAHLLGMLIAEDAEVSPVSLGSPIVSLRGLAGSPGESFVTELGGIRVMAASNPRSGRADIDVWAVEPTTEEALALALTAAGFEPEPDDVFDAARVMNGVPLLGRDFGPDTLPQEAGLHDALHWGKGCYIGQETVARLGHRGQTSRELRLVTFDGMVAEGSAVVFGSDRAPVGSIKSAAAVGSQTVAIVMLKRKAFEHRSPVVAVTDAGDVPGEVNETPIRGFVERRPWNSPDFTANRPHTARRG
jgi:folate-binding protein YgfZ